MLVFEALRKVVITELRWDGKEKFVKYVDSDNPHIWSSPALYSEEMMLKRKKWFEEWLQQNGKYAVDAIRSFHHFGGKGDSESVLLKQQKKSLLTVSITSVEISQKRIIMVYEDIKTGEKSSAYIDTAGNNNNSFFGKS